MTHLFQNVSFILTIELLRQIVRRVVIIVVVVIRIRETFPCSRKKKHEIFFVLFYFRLDFSFIPFIEASYVGIQPHLKIDRTKAWLVDIPSITCSFSRTESPTVCQSLHKCSLNIFETILCTSTIFTLV